MPRKCRGLFEIQEGQNKNKKNEKLEIKKVTLHHHPNSLVIYFRAHGCRTLVLETFCAGDEFGEYREDGFTLLFIVAKNDSKRD